MAVLYITEYAAAPQYSDVPLEPAIADQHVAIGSGSLIAQLGATTRFVRLHTDAICALKFGGPDAVAVATAHRMPANATEKYSIIAGPANFLAVIVAT